MGVSITGIGVVSAIGMSVEENLSALREGRTGIGPLQYLQGTRAPLAGEVKASNDELRAALGVGTEYVSRTSLLGLQDE